MPTNSLTPEMREAETGGVVLEHRYTHYEISETHAFGADDGHSSQRISQKAKFFWEKCRAGRRELLRRRECEGKKRNESVATLRSGTESSKHRRNTHGTAQITSLGCRVPEGVVTGKVRVLQR